MFASVEKQQDRNVVSCDGHMTKAANDSNGIVRDVLCLHVDLVLAEISMILPLTLVRRGLVLKRKEDWLL